MKPTVLIIVALFTLQISYSQVYNTKAIKIAERIDAYPLGAPKNIDVDVFLDLEKMEMVLSNLPSHKYNLKKITEKPMNNGTQLRMSAICPKQKICHIICYFENSKLITLEIRYTSIAYKYYMQN